MHTLDSTKVAIQSLAAETRQERHVLWSKSGSTPTLAGTTAGPGFAGTTAMEKTNSTRTHSTKNQNGCNIGSPMSTSTLGQLQDEQKLQKQLPKTTENIIGWNLGCIFKVRLTAAGGFSPQSLKAVSVGHPQARTKGRKDTTIAYRYLYFILFTQKIFTINKFIMYKNMSGFRVHGSNSVVVFTWLDLLWQPSLPLWSQSAWNQQWLKKKTCSAGCPGTTGFQRKLFGVIFWPKLDIHSVSLDLLFHIGRRCADCFAKNKTKQQLLKAEVEGLFENTDI